MGDGQNERHVSTAVSPIGLDGVFATPTAAAHPMGDANCDDVVNGDDGAAALGAIAEVGSPGCVDLANVKCDDALDVTDVMFIFRFAALLGVQLPGQCRAIGT
jgi:hypothetical protein